MTDICTLILDQHHQMRDRFAELDVACSRADTDTDGLSRLWTPLHQLLDAHAEAEELIFYPLLLAIADPTRDETHDAIGDHNQIRDAASATDAHATGTAAWWDAVFDAREHNSSHMAEEERGALADLRHHADTQARDEAGQKWEAFMSTRLSELAHASHDKNPDAYIARHTAGTGEGRS